MVTKEFNIKKLTDEGIINLRVKAVDMKNAVKENDDGTLIYVEEVLNDIYFEDFNYRKF